MNSTERDLPEDKLLPCPFCGSQPQWRYEQPGGRDGAYELQFRSLGCISRDCFVRPHTEWENRGHFVAEKHGDVRDDPEGSEHVSMWNLRTPAAALASIRAERDAAVEALKPFADFIGDCGDQLPDDMPLTGGSPFARKQVTVADFRRAARAIAGEQKNDA